MESRQDGSRQEETNESSPWDFLGLAALFLNCTFKRSPELSHTEVLIRISREILESRGVAVEVLRSMAYDVAYGIWPDMTEHGWERDDWPKIYEKVKAASILVVSSPNGLGEKSPVCTKVIERLYATSSDLNEAGQYAYYGRVGGCLITGNEYRAKHGSMNILYSLQYLATRYRPGPTRVPRGGRSGTFVPGPRLRRPRERLHRSTTFMTWTPHAPGTDDEDAGAIPAHGDQRSEWEAGCRFGHPVPEFR